MNQEPLNDTVKLALSDFATQFDVISRSRKDTLGRYERVRQEMASFFHSLPIVIDERVAFYETNDKCEANHLMYLVDNEPETDGEARQAAKFISTYLTWKAVRGDHLKTVVYEHQEEPKVPAPEVADAPKPTPPAKVEGKRELTATEKLAAEVGENLETALANVGRAFGLLRHYSIEDGHCYSVENSLSLSRAALEGIWATISQCARLSIPVNGLPSAFISIPIGSDEDNEDGEVVGRFKRIKVFNVSKAEGVREVLQVPPKTDVGPGLQKMARDALTKSGCALLERRRELAEFITVAALANAEGMDVAGYDLTKLVAASKSKNGKGLRKAVFAAKEALKVLYSENHWETKQLVKVQATVA